MKKKPTTEQIQHFAHQKQQQYTTAENGLFLHPYQ